MNEAGELQLTLYQKLNLTSMSIKASVSTKLKSGWLQKEACHLLFSASFPCSWFTPITPLLFFIIISPFGTKMKMLAFIPVRLSTRTAGPQAVPSPTPLQVRCVHCSQGFSNVHNVLAHMWWKCPREEDNNGDELTTCGKADLLTSKLNPASTEPFFTLHERSNSKESQHLSPMSTNE